MAGIISKVYTLKLPMIFKSRKFYIWFFSSLGVCAAFLLYTKLNDMPSIEIGLEAGSTEPTSEFGAKTGKVGEVGIGTVKKAKYIHLDDDKRIDREFGFEKLLHEMGDEWELEKPFMNIFQPKLKCYITADKGNVQIETAVGRPDPKDATLSGNVVIHILPESSGNVQECFLYMDNVDFISETSQFSTTGPVKFISENIQMLGKGLNLVYNNEIGRLEFLKITDLKTLRIKVSSKASLFSKPAEPTQNSTNVKEDQDVNTKPLNQTAKQPLAEPVKEQAYQCVLRKNILIDCPEQVILADEILINEVLFGTAKKEPAEPNNKTASEPTSTPTQQEHTPQVEPKQFTDIVVTCDGGIEIVRMDSPKAQQNLSTAAPADQNEPRNFNDNTGRTIFLTQRIDYNATTGDTIASGRSEIRFYAKDMMEQQQQNPVPITITSQKIAKFSPMSNHVIFEGDALCTMLKNDANVLQQYTLSAPKLTATISSSEDNDIEHLLADGGIVRISNVKTSGENMVSGIELKCNTFTFDKNQQLFWATGPGIIKVDNSRISKPQKEAKRFSLQQPCFAAVRNFDNLKYFTEKNQIIADSKSQELLIDYFPVIQGGYGPPTKITSNRIEADLLETADGKNELTSLTAKGGITYKDEDKEFQGQELFYNASESRIKVKGSNSQPCLLNNVPVDKIDYDLKTGRLIHAEITAPGTLK